MNPLRDDALAKLHSGSIDACGGCRYDADRLRRESFSIGSGNKIELRGAAMVRVRRAVLAAAIMSATGNPVAAQVLDATYRGTMVCDMLPFTSDAMREAIEVTIASGAVRYSHVVRLSKAAVEATAEQGTGTLDGRKISLQGGWKGGSRSYEAKYSGSFVRRGAKLSGTQTWTDGGNTITRACSGAIKRPLKPFLPRQGK